MINTNRLAECGIVGSPLSQVGIPYRSENDGSPKVKAAISSPLKFQILSVHVLPQTFLMLTWLFSVHRSTYRKSLPSKRVTFVFALLCYTAIDEPAGLQEKERESQRSFRDHNCPTL
jgi:hypothetical protein